MDEDFSETENSDLKWGGMNYNDFFTSNLKPAIIHFVVSKQQFKIGEQIMISWKTTGCDQIILLPYGPVLSEGQKTISLETEEDLKIKFELIATNTVNGLMERSTYPIIGEFNLNGKLNENNAHFPMDDKYIARYQQYLKNKEIKKEEEIINNRNGKVSKIESKGQQRKEKSFVKKIMRFFNFLK